MPRQWKCMPDPDGRCEIIRCFASGKTCINTNDFLLEAELSAFHDEDLARATQQINQIFADLEKRNSAGRQLSVLVTSLGHVLAWTTPDDGSIAPSKLVDEDSSESEVVKALRLKVRQ
jgi:hypothetical protein